MEFRDLRFFNPLAETRATANRLPHWQQQGAVYFLTNRTADSMPGHLLKSWESEREAWLRRHPAPWDPKVEQEYHRRFSSAIERWLDTGHGACALRRRDCREPVEDAFRHFEGERCVQLAWVIMPNHVHALFIVKPAFKLEDLVRAWKRHSAVRINRLLGRSGTFWQKDYFDRLVRDQDHFANCVRYIRRNPAKARLRTGDYTLYESELVRGIP